MKPCAAAIPLLQSRGLSVLYSLFVNLAKHGNAQGLANAAWAFAKAGQSNAPVFKVLAKAMEWRVGDPDMLSNDSISILQL